jgi:hypothetical protein
MMSRKRTNGMHRNQHNQYSLRSRGRWHSSLLSVSNACRMRQTDANCQMWVKVGLTHVFTARSACVNAE